MNKYLRRILVILLTIVIIYENATAESVAKAAPANNTNKTETEAGEQSAVFVTDYSLSGEKVVPGNDFTLSIKVKNYSDKVPATDVKILVYNPDGVAPVYGTLSQKYVGVLEPGESKEVSFEYNSWTTIITDTIDFQIQVLSADSSNELILRVPSGIDAPFKVDKIVIPEKAVVGQKTDINVKYEVVGKDNVSNIVMTVEGEGFDAVTSNIGILAPGVSKNQKMSLNFTTEGNYTADVYISYTTVDGSTNKVKIQSGNIVVVNDGEKENIDDAVEQMSQAANDGVSKMLVVGASGTIIVVVLCIIILLFYRRKS